MPIDQYDKDKMTRVNFVPTREFVYTVERNRLLHGRSDDVIQLGFFVYYFIVDCDGDASEILRRAKKVFLIVNEWCLRPDWPSLEEWRSLLPGWFVSACAPERTSADYEREEMERLQLSGRERIARARSRRQSLSEFTDCLDPEFRLDRNYRMWIWGDSELRDENTIVFDIDQMGDPPFIDATRKYS